MTDKRAKTLADKLAAAREAVANLENAAQTEARFLERFGAACATFAKLASKRTRDYAGLFTLACEAVRLAADQGIKVRKTAAERLKAVGVPSGRLFTLAEIETGQHKRAADVAAEQLAAGDAWAWPTWDGVQYQNPGAAIAAGAASMTDVFDSFAAIYADPGKGRKPRTLAEAITGRIKRRESDTYTPNPADRDVRVVLDIPENPEHWLTMAGAMVALPVAKLVLPESDRLRVVSILSRAHAVMADEATVPLVESIPASVAERDLSDSDRVEAMAAAAASN